MMTRYLLIAALSVGGLLLLTAVGVGVRGNPMSSPAGSTALGTEGSLPSLDGATGWLNTPPLSTGRLGGKVVLVEFWTYSCINWRRTRPYVSAWAEKYRSAGLVVIGVHTPEFGFEGDRANVRDAVQELGIEYPVAVDSEHAVWRAFNNEYWPALYLADSLGRLRYHHFGEGNYAETETAIQQLLIEGGHDNFDHAVETIEPQGAEVAADWRDLRSAETYAGYELARGFSSPGGATQDIARVYELPPSLGLNEWALAGEWTVGREAAVLDSSGGRVVFRFHARDVNLIMAPPARGAVVRFRVRLDGQPPGAYHGVDADEQGTGTLDRPMMYQLIRAVPVADRQFEIEFESAGPAVYDFTFG